MMQTTDTRQPQEKICAYEYTVKRGDSFYLIAHRLGVPLRDLLEANPTVNPAQLTIGEVLCVPMEEDDAVREEAKEPESAPEDLLDQPAQDEETQEEPPEEPPESAPSAPQETQPSAPQECPNPDPDFSVCPESNRRTVEQGETIADIQLSSGMSLHTLQTANPQTDLDALSAGQVLCVPDENIPCEAARTLTIQAGEGLEALALRLNVSMGALLRANPCLAPSDFLPGVIICLP